jgi:hypothetical protein
MLSSSLRTDSFLRTAHRGTIMTAHILPMSNAVHEV